jgi:hypothetical protein
MPFSEIALELWRHVTPHVLIATEPVGKQHRRMAIAGNFYIVALDNRH